MQIVIIDDDGEDREFFIQAIKEILPNANCLEFQACRDALHYLNDAEKSPHYIFLDLHMNIMDGKECLSNLKNISGMKETEIVMYSGTVYEKEKQQCLNLGAHHFFVKPRTYPALIDSLKELLAKTN